MFSTSVFPPAAPLAVLPTAASPAVLPTAGPSTAKKQKTMSKFIVFVVVDSREVQLGWETEVHPKYMAFNITNDGKDDRYALKFPSMLDKRLDYQPSSDYFKFSTVFPQYPNEGDQFDFAFVGCNDTGGGFRWDYDDPNGGKLDYDKDVKGDVVEMLDTIRDHGDMSARHMQNKHKNMPDDTKWVTVYMRVE